MGECRGVLPVGMWWAVPRIITRVGRAKSDTIPVSFGMDGQAVCGVRLVVQGVFGLLLMFLFWVPCGWFPWLWRFEVGEQGASIDRGVCAVVIAGLPKGPAGFRRVIRRVW